ncbi:class I SAM-dependent methyltransferase [Thermodesulfobacteriota bacterium]
MQERYIVKRAERFDIIARLIRQTQQSVSMVVDLGCGTGSLMLGVLTTFPKSKVLGIDFDPTLIWLAQARLKKYGLRADIELIDLRDPTWPNAVSVPVDAVISATALHWFNPGQLAGLYNRIAKILKPGGIFLNADHVGSGCPEVDRGWESHRTEMRKIEGKCQSDDWNGFWEEYSKALSLDIKEIHQRVIGNWEGGVEKGLPLAWHFDRLRENDFGHVDCFWRCDCDAIYGGIRK